MSQPYRTLFQPKYLIFLIVLIAFGLRVWQLDGVPPGWRDDELINSLVISQKVLDGNLAVYYADASGHEALYHLLNAGMLGLFGANMVGIRLLSAFVGTLTVALTYQVGRRLFHKKVGVIAAAALAFSFWSLMYSRIGLRHVLTPALTLTTFYFFWQALGIVNCQYLTLNTQRRSLANFVLAGLFMALGFYTYFASRGVPLILLAFCGYLLLVAPNVIKRRWQGIVLMFGITAVLTIPLLITLRQQPESESRVGELAVPLVEAQQGNFEPIKEFTLTTLSMFHAHGDGEWLYNIPDRPVFSSIGAIFFWFGVLIAIILAIKPVINRIRTHHSPLATHHSHAAAFLLVWWLAGISPGFISVPAASLGHTIMAQPAVFILAAIPIYQLSTINYQLSTVFAVGMLVFGIAARDLPDYFVEWPQRGMVRFLYRGDIYDAATYLNEQEELINFGISGLLAGSWDKLALDIDVNREITPRWYNPERVLMIEPSVSLIGFPEPSTEFIDRINSVDEAGSGGYSLTAVSTTLNTTDSTCFENGLCVATAVYHPDTYRLELGWWVKRPLYLPKIPLISNPPPPGVYSGPRLAVFVQLQDVIGTQLANDDGFWVDPTTLQVGDQFLQQHWLLPLQDGIPTTILFGLYDPKTGERVLIETGQDYMQIDIVER